MRDLEYQARVLRTFDSYLVELIKQKKRAEAIAELARTKADLSLAVPDFTEETWKVMQAESALPKSRAGIPFSPRRDGLNGPVPNICLKVPTGGGKTYLATTILSRILGTYIGRNTGFVLWIVPNDAIYSQPKRHFADRDHPYRQMLDRAGAGRVKLLEKDDPLDARDVESHLCVMLLMLQSANREGKERLRLFRDRGNVHGFFPTESDGEAHRALLERVENLDAYGRAGDLWPLIKDSLGNVLRLVRPIIVMDEGHRAISDLAFATLYGFNPCFLVELTATPKDKQPKDRTKPIVRANVLVDVLGSDLDREGMIKMPLNVLVKGGKDWRNTLRAATEKLDDLQTAAEKLRAERDRYIRPILLVQVERTGDDQVDAAHIHAQHAKAWLVRAGFDERQIAIKTANVNDLNAPENIDLLAPTCPVRVIITKQALQEGWDCPFAYVLCALAASRNLAAMTQLVGRILRQPHAEKAGIALLDECYVVCHHPDTGQVVEAIKEGLEEDGLGDLVKQIVPVNGTNGGGDRRRIGRRDKFRKLEIFLPLVLRCESKRARPLDYEQDVLYGLDWGQVNAARLASQIPLNTQAAETQMKRIRLADKGDERIVSEDVGHTAEAQLFDPVYAVRMVSDIVVNPWIARGIVGDFIKELRVRDFDDDKLGVLSGLIIEGLRKWLSEERDKMAEAHFKEEVKSGRIQFRLRTDMNNWDMTYQLLTDLPQNSRTLRRKDDNPLEKSLFAPIYEADFSSTEEREVAVYLDGDAALTWWHRNVAKAGQYAVQGWRKDKVYPDLIFALQRNDGIDRLIVLEMKGEHLSGNPDTEYKKALLRFMSENYCVEHITPAGKLELVEKGHITVECDLVLMTEWRSRLPAEFLKT